MRRSGLFVIFILSLFILPSLLKAEEGAEKERQQANNVAEEYRQKLKETITVEEPSEEFKQELDSYVRFMPSSNAEHQSGKVRIIDSASEYSYDFKLFGKLPTQAGFIAQYISLNNTTQVKLPSRLTGISVGMETTFPFFNFDKTYLRFGMAPSFFSDGWYVRASAHSLFMCRMINWSLSQACGCGRNIKTLYCLS
jgi:hypothetical protein